LVPYLIFIAASVLVCAACAGAMYAQSREAPGGIAATLALLAIAYWGVCQLIALPQSDPVVATWITRAATPGWVFLGPLCLQVFTRATGTQEPWMRRAVLGLGAFSGVVLVTALASPWVVAGVRSTSWGYAIVPGPLFAIATLVNVIAVGGALVVGRARRARLSRSEAQQRWWISLAIGIPVTLMGVTDVLLPIAGVAFPALAPGAFAPLACIALWLRVRLGRSPLEPSQVANEIFEILPDGVALIDNEERIRLVNPSLARLCGCSIGRLVDAPFAGLIGAVDGDPEFAELRGPEGRRLPVSVSEAPLRDPSGEPLGRVVVVRDLSEVADLRKRLVMSARLAAVGELAAGIAHEINNPLAFVRSNLSQLESMWKALRPRKSDIHFEATLVQDIDELVAESIEGIDRAVEIVRSVRSFAHAGSSSRESTDLRPLLENVLHVASAQLRDRVNVLREFDATLPHVVCAPQQLRQVFLNLVVNAAQAVEDGGSVLVATRSEGRHVIVSVADDGCGIPPESIDRIFDPFFTTKPVGVGTGLGLGIVHQIVTSHGGEIQVESTPGRGTVFRVRLPAAPAE